MKEEQVGGLTLSISKLVTSYSIHDCGTGIRIDTYIDQWDGIENLEIYIHTDFNTGAHKIQWGKE